MSDRVQELYIAAGQSDRNYWRDLWRYRELLYFLAWRDMLVRYKQTAVGIAWAILRPLITVLVFTLVFGRFAKLPSGNVPYPLLVLAGALPWEFFAGALADTSSSLVGNANLISKVYFPRLIVPLSSLLVSIVDFLIFSSMLVVLMVWYRTVPTINVVFLPLFILLAFAAATAIGLWFGALNVKYRDFRYIVPVVVRFGLLVSPVGFSSSIVPEKWRLLYSLNPMVGVIDGFRWAIFGGASALYWPGLLISSAVVLVLLATGAIYFRKVERTFADII